MNRGTLGSTDRRRIGADVFVGKKKSARAKGPRDYRDGAFQIGDPAQGPVAPHDVVLAGGQLALLRFRNVAAFEDVAAREIAFEPE